MKYFCSTRLTPFAFILPVLAALAQSVTAQQVLPELAPQIVEITGDLTISFPSLRRQPLAGFNPPPRVPDIPPNRIPYVDAYKQEGTDLPPSPITAPVPPSMSSVAHRRPSSALIEVGVGRYVSGYIKGNISAPVGKRATLTAWADINGTDGRDPFSDIDDISTAADNQAGGVAIRSNTGALRLGADVELARNSFNMFGATAGTPRVFRSAPDRTVSEWLGSVFLSSGSRDGTYASVNVGIGGSSVDTDIKVLAADIPEPPANDDETRFFISGTAGVAASTGRLESDLFISRRTIEFSGTGNKSISSGNGAAGFHFDYSERVSVSVAARIMGFNAEGQSESGGDRDLVYFAPDFRVRYAAAPGLQITFANAPGLETGSFADIYRLAPFIQDGPIIQPVLTSTNLFGEASFMNERASVRGRIGWKDIQNYRVIEHDASSSALFDLGYAAVSYEDASIVYVEAEAMLSLMTGMNTSVTATYRDGELSDSDTDIPYFSPFSLSAFLTLDPLDGDLLLRGTVKMESSRYRDRAKTEKVDRVFGIGLEAKYFVTEQTSAVVGVRNLGKKSEFWENYETDSGVFYAGIQWWW